MVHYAGRRELAPLPQLLQASRGAVRRHGSGEDAAVCCGRGGGSLRAGSAVL